MSDCIGEHNVFLGVEAQTADDALVFLANKAFELGAVESAEAALEGLRAREEQGTTAMLGGFAIPHCKSTAVKQETVLIARFAGDVAWDSMDGEPVKVAISLLVPESEAGTTFLKMLSKVAVLLMNEEFRTGVLATDDPARIVELVSGGFAE